MDYSEINAANVCTSFKSIYLIPGIIQTSGIKGTNIFMIFDIYELDCFCPLQIYENACGMVKIVTSLSNSILSSPLVLRPYG